MEVSVHVEHAVDAEEAGLQRGSDIHDQPRIGSFDDGKRATGLQEECIERAEGGVDGDGNDAGVVDHGERSLQFEAGKRHDAADKDPLRTRRQNNRDLAVTDSAVIEVILDALDRHIVDACVEFQLHCAEDFQ